MVSLFFWNGVIIQKLTAVTEVENRDLLLEGCIKTENACVRLPATPAASFCGKRPGRGREKRERERERKECGEGGKKKQSCEDRKSCGHRCVQPQNGPTSFFRRIKIPSASLSSVTFLFFFENFFLSSPPPSRTRICAAVLGGHRSARDTEESIGVFELSSKEQNCTVGTFYLKSLKDKFLKVHHARL